MFELCKSFRFDGAHTLEREIGTEGSRRIHGHSWVAEVVVRGTPDPATGMILDVGFFEIALDEARKELDGRLLNDVEGLGPATLENLSAWVWRKVVHACPGLCRVTIRRDSAGEYCSYFGPQ